MTCAPNVLTHALWGAIVLAVAALAWFVGLYRIERDQGFRGQQPQKSFAQPPAFVRKRLRFWRHDVVNAGSSDLFEYGQSVQPEQIRKHPELLKRLKDVARQLALQKGVITTDDIHLAHPIPDGIDGRVLGAVFRTSEWICVGHVKSTRTKDNHGRRIARWQLKETLAA